MCECTGITTPSAKSMGRTPPGMTVANGTKPVETTNEGTRQSSCDRGVRTRELWVDVSLANDRAGLIRGVHISPANATPDAW
jgi:hypothetical protein